MWSDFDMFALHDEGDIPIQIITTMNEIQWNLSVTTTSMIKFISCDLFSSVF